MTKRLVGVSLVVLLSVQFEQPGNASILQLDAGKVFEQSVTHHLRLAEKR